MEERIKQIIENKINPVLAVHDGKCELVNYDNGVISLKLNGGCVGCPGRKMTIQNGITPLFKQELSESIEVKLID